MSGTSVFAATFHPTKDTNQTKTEFHDIYTIAIAMELIPSSSSDDMASMKRSLLSDPDEAALGGIVCVDDPQLVVNPNDFRDVHENDVEADNSRHQSSPDEYFGDVEGDENDIPFAVACIEPLLPNTGEESREETRECEEGIAAQPVVDFRHSQSSIMRPEFLLATAIKPSLDSPIGLTFKKKNGGVYLSRVSKDGLFHKSGVQCGDRVVAVNNVSCIEAPLRMIRDMIEKSESDISICVRNKYGDPHSVLTSVQKPSRDSKLGICFQVRRGALTVSRVRPNSLFANSLLMPDHRCMMINGQACESMGSHEAAALTADAERVTIVSRARGDLAIVLAVGEVRRWSAVALGAGVAAAALSAFGSVS